MRTADFKQEIVSKFLNSGFLVNPGFLEKNASSEIERDFFHAQKEGLLFIDFDALQIIRNGLREINWIDFEASKALFEKGKAKTAYEQFISLAPEKTPAPVSGKKPRICFAFKGESRKREVSHFVSYYNRRLESLGKILSQRQELENPMSIGRLKTKKDRESVSLIGMVKEKDYTKNKNIILELEDESGAIKVLVNQNKPELYSLAKDIVQDEVIGVTGVNAENIVFANNILWPDIPASKEFKKHPEESYAVFISDLHVGSKMFLKKEFSQFISWINAEVGNESQKEIAKKVGYIFIIGDLIDGVGIYPNQENELVVRDVYEQYSICAELLKKIPGHIEIIICPGNHDAMRIAEPQPELYMDFAKPLWDLPNVTMVSNPSVVNIASTEKFPGFDILLYHGYSFDYYVPNVESIRNSGGYEKADMIMRFLLQRRHLAPTHTSTLFLPEAEEDPLVIKNIPDIFATGHIHNKPVVSNYRNVTMISCGCWQSITPFQEKVGHNPGPAKVPVINLKTRDVKILRFDK